MLVRLQHCIPRKLYVTQLIYLTVAFVNILSVSMSCSNEFFVEVKQGDDCWKPASVSEYQKDMFCVYVRDNPIVALSVAPGCVRWPKSVNTENSSELKEKMEVEFCEKHNNYISNRIYTWNIGEIGELQEDKCLVKTSQGEVWLPNKRIFPYVQSLNFKDEDVMIFSSCIDTEGDLKKIYNADSLKLLCEELKAITVCYEENGNRLVVLSTEPQTLKLCENYPDKNKEEIPQEIHVKQADEKTYSKTLTVEDISLVDIATNCIGIAKKVRGIRSIEHDDCSFKIVGSNLRAVNDAIDILDMVSVDVEFPSSNRNKVQGIENNRPRGLKKIKVIHEDPFVTRVKLIGTKNSVNIAKEKLNSSMNKRIGPKNDLQNDYPLQEDGTKVRYVTPDCDSSYQQSYHRKISAPTIQSRSLRSSESDNSPLSPPQHFHPQAKYLTNDTQIKIPFSSGFPQTEASVPYTAKRCQPKTHENSERFTQSRPRKEHHSVSGDDRNFERQRGNKARGGPKKHYRPKNKIASEPNHSEKEEAYSASFEKHLDLVEDSVFTNSETPDQISEQYFERQQSDKARGGPKKHYRPKNKIASEPNHSEKEEACSASLEKHLVPVEDSVFTNSEIPNQPSKQ